MIILVSSPDSAVLQKLYSLSDPSLVKKRKVISWWFLCDGRKWGSTDLTSCCVCVYQVWPWQLFTGTGAQCTLCLVGTPAQLTPFTCYNSWKKGKQEVMLVLLRMMYCLSDTIVLNTTSVVQKSLKDIQTSILQIPVNAYFCCKKVVKFFHNHQVSNISWG